MNIEPSPDRPALALIAGPTASGKSALAMELAAAVDGIVINADSAQVYRDLRVLSARPSPADEAQVPHRLFGHIDGADACSAARWAHEARGEIAAAHGAGKVPILVGGTGLYLRTLIDGIAPVPPIDPAVRADVRAMTVAEAYGLLQSADPAAAARLNPADTTRVARALEVVRSTGQPLVQWQQQRVGGIGDSVSLTAAVLLPDRAWLVERCDARFAAMMDEGAIEEVRALMARADLPVAAPVRGAIGVNEINAMIDGTLSRAEAIAGGQLATRRYAKRQFTWFRNQPPPTWERLYEQPFDTYAIKLATKLRC